MPHPPRQTPPGAVARARRRVAVPALLLLAAGAAAAAAASSSADSAHARPDSVASPYGPAGYDASGRVEIWRLPVLAREDTFGVHLRYALREIEIRAEILSLKEILHRAQEGERRRREAVRDLAYTRNTRVSVFGGRRPGAQQVRIFEERERIYFKRPDRRLEVHLADRKYGDQDQQEELKPRAQVAIEVRDALDFAQAPFYLEDIDAYRYRIEDREVFPDRVVYAVGFTPRSDFDIEPTGTFWIDAADFVVIYEEMRFEHNPAPLVVKSIDHIVREREQVDGHWVVTRLQGRAELRLSFLTGFRKIEFEARFSDFQFNTGLPDSIFVSTQ